MTSIDGLISGLNTTDIINQLMAVERLPEKQLTDSKTASQTLVTTFQSMNSLFTALGTAASAFVPDTITGYSAWTSTKATSSNPTGASVVVGPKATPGTTRFTVMNVATAGSIVSSGTVGSLTAPVTSGAPFLLSKGAGALGFQGFEPGATLAAGGHAVQVTQSSAPPVLHAASPLQGSITIDASNNSVAFYLDGAVPAKTFTLGQGTYTPAQLASELQRASGGTLSASVGSDGALQVASTREGSAATLQLASANSALGLTDTATIAAGTDAKVTLDGVETTITSVGAGGQVTLTGKNGDTIVATLAGGLRAGAATATSIASGTGLSDVVDAINASGAGITATAVGVSAGTYRLQLSSDTTGSGSNLTVNAGAFLPALGSMQQLSDGTDTVLHVGTGPGAYDVTSPNTTVDGMLPGVTITALRADPTTPISVQVSSDSSGMADKMAALVDAANSILSYVDKQSAYDVDSKTGGPLVGDSMSRDLRQRLTDAFIGTSSNTPALSGVSVQRDGSVSFDRDAFLAAYANDPSGVAATMTAMSQQLSSVAKQASDPISGSITTRVAAEQASIKDYTDQISAFEDRMTLKQQTLKTQYAALETALGSLQSQSQWLTGQLASLPTYKSSSS